ncbi:MAG: TetR/AcrR family transcriptional regulator [Bacteroidales bacterium]|nr:TetR/AcrR family transcriptional regulator [Bacteroidales bacterium]
MSRQPRDNKKDVIIQAAEEEFLQKGYDGARMMEIAQKAGVGHPLLHYHFSNKRKLFQNVVSGKLNVLMQSVLISLDEPDRDFSERISLMVSRHFDFLQEHGNYIRFILKELDMHPELMAQVRLAVVEQFNEAKNRFQVALDQEIEKGNICYIDAQTLILDIVSLNVFCILTNPLVGNVVDDSQNKAFLEMRKSENVKMVLGRLQIK